MYVTNVSLYICSMFVVLNQGNTFIWALNECIALTQNTINITVESSHQ